MYTLETEGGTDLDKNNVPPQEMSAAPQNAA
jgi:hypothetical protein